MVKRQPTFHFEIVLLLGGFIDLITSLFIQYTTVTITPGIVTKLMILAALMVWFLFYNKSRFKRMSLIYFGLLGLYSVFFIFSLTKDYPLIDELNIYIRNFYFPLMLIILINYFEMYQGLREDYFVPSLLVYVVLLIVPTLLNVALPTYTEGLGQKGFFFSANEIGAILSILFPFLVHKAIVTNRYRVFYFVSLIVTIYVMLQFGTKVPLLSVFLVLLGFIVFYIQFVIRFKQSVAKKRLLSLFIILVLATGISINSDSVQKVEDHITDVTSEDGKEVDYTNVVFSSRDIYNQRVLRRYKQEDVYIKLVGMGYYHDTDYRGIEIYNNVEIDYVDILYRNGIVGFVLFYAPLLFVVLVMVIHLDDLFTDVNTLGTSLSVLLMMSIGFFAGHVFTAPAVSLFTATILAKSKQMRKWFK